MVWIKMFQKEMIHLHEMFIKLFLISNLMSTAYAEMCRHFCNHPSPWLIQAQNVCYETMGDKYGTFKIKQDCQLEAMRLSHVSGKLRCLVGDTFSRWGCRVPFDKNCPNCLATILVNSTDKKRFLPDGPLSKYGDYGLAGFNEDDDVMIFKKKVNLTAGQEFQIWYSEDFVNGREDNNFGIHCVDVDVSCLV